MKKLSNKEILDYCKKPTKLLIVLLPKYGHSSCSHLTVVTDLIRIILSFQVCMDMLVSSNGFLLCYVRCNILCRNVAINLKSIVILSTG